MNRNRIKRLTTAVLLLAAMAAPGGCKKEDRHKTTHPDKAAVRVATDWSGITNDASQPPNYLLCIGPLTHTVSGTDNTFKHLLDEGRHTLLVYNTPAGITINGAKADVNTLPDGTIEPLPHYLFSAAREFDAVKDDTLNLAVKMQQSFRLLQLSLKLDAAQLDRIASTTATLTGIAHTIDLSTAQPDVAGAGKTVAPLFKPGAVTPALIASMRLAGMAGSGPQILTLAITLTNGTVVPIEADLTQLLSEFGNEIKPLALNATIELPDDPTQVGASGSITHWEVIDNGNITIH